jgi:hypothetical protein
MLKHTGKQKQLFTNKKNKNKNENKNFAIFDAADSHAACSVHKRK